MKSRYLLLAACLFLITTLACVIMAVQPPESGVRLPVHCSNGKMGYIDDSGRMIIGAAWDTATPFGEDDHAIVSRTREINKFEEFFHRWIPGPSRIHIEGIRYYKIDRLGNRKPHQRSDFGLATQSNITIPADELTRVEPATEYQWILKYGNAAFPKTWQKPLEFKEDDPAAVFRDGRWGFVDRLGTTVIPIQWDETNGFDGTGKACVRMDRKWGVIDRTGRLVVPLLFKSLGEFDGKNMCPAQLASGWGFIDPQGKMKIPFRYRKVEPFDRFEMSKVEIASHQGSILCGWINRSGEFVVPPLYDAKEPTWASNFTDHQLLPVIDSKGTQLIDRKGQAVVANAKGKLEPVEDSKVPGKFWIRTVPYRPGATTLPFEPACYDQTGKPIWRDNVWTRRFTFAVIAALSALLSAIFFAMGTLRLKEK